MNMGNPVIIYTYIISQRKYDSSHSYISFIFRERGYLRLIVGTLMAPFRQNRKLQLSGDAVPYMTDAYKRRGFIERFQTLCFVGIPVKKEWPPGRVTITDVSLVTIFLCLLCWHIQSNLPQTRELVSHYNLQNTFHRSPTRTRYIMYDLICILYSTVWYHL